jgi:GR25 family glycosyltransferase involved in LPS biosynthesis
MNKSINSYFDKVYVLNLHRREDRIKIMQNRLDKCDITYSYFGATDGNVMKPLWDALKNPYIKNPNYLGCIVSHLSIYEDALTNKYDKVLIIEDDERIIDNANEEFGKQIDQINTIDYELLYLGFIPLNDNCTAWDYSILNDRFVSSNVVSAKNLWGLYAYAIRASLMKEMLHVYSNTYPMEIDRYFVNHIQPRGGSFAVLPQIFIAEDGKSDNSGHNEVHMTIRSTHPNYRNRIYI